MLHFIISMSEDSKLCLILLPNTQRAVSLPAWLDLFYVSQKQYFYYIRSTFLGKRPLFPREKHRFHIACPTLLALRDKKVGSLSGIS